MKYINGISNSFKLLENILPPEKCVSKKLVCFGYNAGAKICVLYYLMNGIKIDSIIDNAEYQHDRHLDYLGVPLLYPCDVVSNADEDTIFIISSIHQEDIINNIYNLNNNIKNDQIVCINLQDEEVLQLNNEVIELENNISVSDCQNELLNMLKFIHNVCEQNGIKYFISGGTLLGAVRHKGFIPWDDDIDVSMFWSDYIKFIDAVEDTDKYFVDSMISRNKAYSSISTLGQLISKTTYSDWFNFPLKSDQGLTVDIWPLIGFPDSLFEQKKFEEKLVKLGDKWKNNVVMTYNSIYYNKETHKRLIEEIVSTMDTYDESKTGYVGSGYCGYYIAYNQKKRWFDKAVFDKRIKLRFVDSDFWAPIGYDEILKCYYGDYMKIPSNKSMDTNVPSRFFKKRSWRNV